jgi:hypothetical protein
MTPNYSEKSEAELGRIMRSREVAMMVRGTDIPVATAWHIAAVLKQKGIPLTLENILVEYKKEKEMGPSVRVVTYRTREGDERKVIYIADVDIDAITVISEPVQKNLIADVPSAVTDYDDLVGKTVDQAISYVTDNFEEIQSRFKGAPWIARGIIDRLKISKKGSCGGRSMDKTRKKRGGGPQHFMEDGGQARPRPRWYRDMGAIPGEPCLFYPVPEPTPEAIKAAAGVIYEEDTAFGSEPVLYATVRGQPIRNEEKHKDYFDEEEEAMIAVEHALEEVPSCLATLNAAAELLAERCSGEFRLPDLRQAPGVLVRTSELKKLGEADRDKLSEQTILNMPARAARVIIPIVGDPEEVYRFLEEHGVAFDKITTLVTEYAVDEKWLVDIEGKVKEPSRLPPPTKRILLVSTKGAEQCEACTAVMDFIKGAIESGKVQVLDMNDEAALPIIASVFGNEEFDIPMYLIAEDGKYTIGDLRDLLVEFAP